MDSTHGVVSTTTICPLAADLQQILIQELCSLNLVTEDNIDSLFNKVERITELYTTAGKADNAIDEK